jgi:hypothetical protein
VVDDSNLVTRLPRVWIGFCIAGIVLLIELLLDARSPNVRALGFLVSLSGWFYWLYCVYKYHDVMSSIQGYNHPITSGRAVGMHWIPFYQFYWVFKWPMEIGTFVNWRLQSPRAMNGVIPGLLVLAGFVLYQINAALGLAILFSAGIYLSRRIRDACLAPPVPKAMHASATAGPLGLG